MFRVKEQVLHAGRCALFGQCLIDYCSAQERLVTQKARPAILYSKHSSDKYLVEECFDAPFC
jgi:hypothetical protein